MAEALPGAVLDLIELSTDYLTRRGVASPRLDAELLLSEVLGLARIQLYVNFDRPVAAVARDLPDSFGVLTYLVTELRCGAKSVPYSMVSALGRLDG